MLMTDTPSPRPWTYLRRARLRAGLTPTGAAKALEMGLSHYCLAEKGQRGMSDEKVILAARVFNVDVVELDASRPLPPYRVNGVRRDGAAA